MDEILDKPFRYKPLRNVLKNMRRVQIGSFVLIFEIDQTNKTVIFNTFQYHDSAYNPKK